MPDRVAAARCGSAMAGAPCYTAMVLHFRWFLFPQNWWSARNSWRGSSTGGRLWSRMCGGKVHASTFSDGGGALQGSAHDKVEPNGCGVECRTPASGWWSSRSVAHGVVMKEVNLGFASVFFEILAQMPFIYRGSRLIFSCACRAQSPCFPIRLGFDFEWFCWDFSRWWRFWLGGDPARGRPRPVLGRAWVRPG
jgi:hypothetical protein